MSNKSILIFTVHKAASIGLFDLARQMAIYLEEPLYSINVQNAEPPYLFPFSYNDTFEGKKGIFCPLRAPTPLDYSSYDVIIHLRDPRDILVSLFYSLAYTHPLEKNNPKTPYVPTQKERENMLNIGINSWILNDLAPDFFKINSIALRYEIYFKILADYPHVTLLDYNELILNFPKWLQKLEKALSHPKKQGLAYYLRKMSSRAFEPHEGGITQHKRKMLPGDYKEKLSPETIQFIEQKFHNVIHHWKNQSAE